MNIQEATKIATKILSLWHGKIGKKVIELRYYQQMIVFYNASFQIAMGQTLSDIGNLQPMTSWQMIGKL